MSWNLFQKIINYIIFYGFNIIDVYTNLLTYAQKQLNVHFDLVWTPILALLFIYCTLGLVSAIIGIRVGRKVLKQSNSSNVSTFSNKYSEFTSKPKHDFNYSLLWLFINIAFITISLFLLNFTSWQYWSIAITGIALIWVYRYKRALRQLSKPRFWISFVVITMITAFVFSKIQTNSLANGLLVGIQMNFRAIIIILGFTVLGTELYNPKIREFFLKTWFKQLPLALELSFKSLPTMIANTPDFKIIIKNPISVIYQVISQAESRLAELKSNLSKKVFIISGAIGQGKTLQVQKVIETLHVKNFTVGGIYSVRVTENDKTIGYDIVDILNKKSEVFLRISNDVSLEKLGRFRINPNGLRFGLSVLNSTEISSCNIVVIDEVGTLELENKGWAKSINKLLNSTNSHLLLSVRDTATEQVIQHWKLKNYTVFKVSENDFFTVSNRIAEEI